MSEELAELPNDLSKSTPDDVIVKNKKRNKIIILVGIALFLGISGLIVFIAVTATVPKKVEQEECDTAHEGYGLTQAAKLGNYSSFAVAADDKDCSTIGKNILERGGSAVDATIAAALCNSVMNAQSMGLGGGHFFNIYLKDQNKSYIIDAREVAPKNAYESMFVDNPGKSLTSGLATAIAGEIYGYWEAHRIGGKLPWKDLFEPTIKLCEEGFRISRPLASALRLRENRIKQNKALSDIFINPLTDKVYQQNDTIKRLTYARTLRNLSEHGPQLFYNGLYTGILVSEINQNGGNVSLEDFLEYRPRIHENRFMVKLDENLRIYTVPPPSSGILTPAIMKIMRGYNLETESSMTNESLALFYHRLTETYKHMYSRRTLLGDELFVDVTQLMDDLRDDEYLNKIRSKIDDTRTFPKSYYGTASSKSDSGTAHISVLAPNGDAVAFTSTINNYFGAKFAGEYSGILYSDIMDDFSTPGTDNSFGFEPSPANFIRPGKKPLSSMTPIIVVDNDDQVRLVLGASGGSKIISAVSQIAIKTLWMGVDIKSAIDARRIHHQLSPEVLQLEEDFPDHLRDSLRKIGHKTQCFEFGGSTVQGILVKDGRVWAYSDPRKGGVPDGV